MVDLGKKGGRDSAFFIGKNPHAPQNLPILRYSFKPTYFSIHRESGISPI